MTNVIAFPFPPTHRWVQIANLANGAEYARAGFPTVNRDPGAPHDWIVETVAHSFDIPTEKVGFAEGPDGEDIVTVDGLPVYQINILRNVC